jgi:hypothetical protein
MQRTSGSIQKNAARFAYDLHAHFGHGAVLGVGHGVVHSVGHGAVHNLRLTYDAHRPIIVVTISYLAPIAFPVSAMLDEESNEKERDRKERTP